ncbi:hypothetical protein FQA47_020447 [Oryzias melastigma]|uniref:Uncharacterized protein n=1 Tax=Oryzias melastigma TaxID=30732 RepID=A0A834KZH1_ORYME|nr:hypothetical protein FQA47_020447 [Oryzias melastigma]
MLCNIGPVLIVNQCAGITKADRGQRAMLDQPRLGPKIQREVVDPPLRRRGAGFMHAHRDWGIPSFTELCGGGGEAHDPILLCPP